MTLGEQELTEEAWEFAVRLRACRTSAGLSQEELAGRAGLSARAISNLERGRARRPYPNTLRRLADALDLRGGVRAEFIGAAGRRLTRGTDGTGERAPAAPRAVPRQLPAGIGHFTGRRAEIDRLTAAQDALESAHAGTVAVVAISGMPGVGKTALAVHWARQHAERFPDGQLYVDLGGFDPAGMPVGTATVVRGFLDALGVPPARIPADVGAQLGLYRSVLAGKRMLIVLDNARDSRQVRPLLSGAGGCLVLVTSRSQLSGLIALDGAVPLPVGLLTDAEASDLLARRLGARRISRERRAAQELIGVCARLPLALNIAAAHAATHPAMSLGELCAGLRDARSQLEMLSAGPDRADVRAVFSWSYDALGAPAARLFRLLGLHPGPDISLQAAASLAAMDLGQARRALAELTGANLVSEHSAGRYVLHDLLRAYAAEQASAQDGADERRAALSRVLDHYLHTAQTAARIFDPRYQPLRLPDPVAGAICVRLSGVQQARAWCQAELAVLAAAIRCAASSGFATHAWQLALSIETMPEQWRQWRVQVAIGELVLAAAAGAGDLTGQAHAHCHLGKALTVGGDHEQARDHLRRALALFGQVGDRVNVADAETALAQSLIILHEPAQALHPAEHAAQVCEDTGDAIGLASALNHTGRARTMLGQCELGLAACERALELARGTDHPNVGYVESATLDSIGLVHHRLGQYAEAIASFRQALAVLDSLGETWLTAYPLDHLGDTCQAAGDHDAARDAWKQAVTVLDDLQLPDADAIRGKLTQLAKS